MYAVYSGVNGLRLHVSWLYLCSTIHLQIVYIDVRGEVAFTCTALWQGSIVGLDDTLSPHVLVMWASFQGFSFSMSNTSAMNILGYLFVSLKSGLELGVVQCLHVHPEQFQFKQ